MNREYNLKRKLVTLNRIFSYGIKNLFRNAWLSIAAIAVMFVALTIIVTTVVLNVAANNAISELSKNLKASIYLKDTVDENRKNELELEFKSAAYVDTVEFVSKAEAKKRFTASFQNDEQLLEGLTLIGQNTLPASYEISVVDLSKLKDVESIAGQEKYKDIIDSISLGRTDARKTIDRAASTQGYITSASILSAVIFTVISVLIIFNTIRIAIFTRGEEIRNMKLIGATPGFIRGPFLVEASLYGVIAGILAVFAVYSIIISLGSKIATQAEFAETYRFFTSTSTIAAIFIVTVMTGIIVGMFSSALAMEKHLKLKRW